VLFAFRLDAEPCAGRGFHFTGVGKADAGQGWFCAVALPSMVKDVQRCCADFPFYSAARYILRTAGHISTSAERLLRLDGILCSSPVLLPSFGTVRCAGDVAVCGIITTCAAVWRLGVPSLRASRRAACTYCAFGLARRTPACLPRAPSRHLTRTAVPHPSAPIPPPPDRRAACCVLLPTAFRCCTTAYRQACFTTPATANVCRQWFLQRCRAQRIAGGQTTTALHLDSLPELV